MQITLTLIIAVEADGKAQATVTRCSVSERGGSLGAALADVVTTLPPVGPAPAAAAAPPPVDASREMNRARHLAHQLKIDPAQVEQALATRPAGRVAEVLAWVQGQTRKTVVKSPTALFWAIVVKD